MMDRTLAHNLNNGERSEDVRIKEVSPFGQWLLKDAVKKGLDKAGFRFPTVIQASAIPLGKTGIDLLIQSKSGTGKTLIFSLILLENCFNAPGLHSIIVTPTREIAIQINMVLKEIGQYCKKFKVVNTIGGSDIAIDRKQLQNAKTVVGTPGRLVHLIQSDILKVTNIKLIVLDEADQLFSSSHRKNLEIILNAIPTKRQILACSATFCNNLDEDLAKVMRNPLLISTKDQITALLGIKQYIYELTEEKTSVLEMEAKVATIFEIFRRVPFKLCMIFAGSQSRAESYSSYLSDGGWKCEMISGAQKQTKRNEIFKKFQNFDIRILVSTDLMARGIDSEHVNLVINIDAPKDMVTYLHRIGRAGRFGSHGIAITLVSSGNESNLFKKILQEVGCGMIINEFPKIKNDDRDENFWVPNSFKTELQQEKTTESEGEESCVAILRDQSQRATHSNEPHQETELDSNVTFDTKTYCIDSKDSAVNVLPELVAENKENLLHLNAEDTPTSNRSSVQLSANTIDDASSIAADSVFSSMLELQAPHPSLALDKAQNSDYLSAELKEANRDQLLKKDFFMDYSTNVLENDEEQIETKTELAEDSKHSKINEKRQQVEYDDLFADYTNFICVESEGTDEHDYQQLNIPVCSTSLVINDNENNTCNNSKEQKAENGITSEELLTISQTFLQDTNSSYSADSEPSMESKTKENVDPNQRHESEFYFEESLVHNDELNTQVHLNDVINEEEDIENVKDLNKINEQNYDNIKEYHCSNEDVTAEEPNNISPLYGIWIKEYWRQVNFIQSYVKFSFDYRKEFENN